MKKILRKIMAIAAAVTLVSAFASCSGDGDDGTDDTSDKKAVPAGSGTDAKFWASANATMIDSLAGKSTSWGEEINIGKDVASRIQVGSKVIFDIDINGEYAKFMVASGWSNCNTPNYYNTKGKALPVKENADNEGVYETLDGLEKGTYYFEVTAENIEILQAGFSIRGNFTLNKIGITNLGEPVADPDASIELVKPAAKDGYKTFWAQCSGAVKGSVMLVLNYESKETDETKELGHPALDKSVTLSNVVIDYIINDGEAKQYKADKIVLPKNEWGTDYQAKVPVFADYKVTKNDAIYIKIAANVDTAEAVQASGVSIIQGNLIDTDASVKYWKEMCIDEQKKQLLSGITYKAAEGGNTESGTNTAVFSGSTELAWGNRAPEVKDLAGKTFVGFEITYNTTADSDSCFKLLDTSWGAYELSEVTGDGTLRSEGDDSSKAVDLQKGKTDAKVVVKFASNALTTVKSAGVGFQGAPGTTITKIVLVEAE